MCHQYQLSVGWFHILLLTISATAGSAVAGNYPDDRAINHSFHEERRILVAFRDGTIGRLPVGDGASAYRRRGSYGNSTWASRRAGLLAERYRLETLEQWPIPVLGMHCAIYRVPPEWPIEGVLAALSKEEKVDLAERVRIFRTQSDANSDPYAQLQSSLISMRVGAAHQYATGRDVEIAVIDTGIDANHPDLRDQIVEVKNFTRATHEAVADIHGTAVAGIISAIAGNRIGIRGVAPGAKILSLKACWPERVNRPESLCDTFTLAQALNTTIERKVRIVNLSLAGPHDPLLERLIAKGVAEGITFAAAVPADGAANSFPASVPGVIAVRSAGAAPTSSGLASHAVTAPGSELLTTLPQGTYSFVTGSSYATAVVSGLIALLLENHPQLNTRSLLEVLQSAGGRQTAVTGGKAGANLDACGALAHLDASIICPATGAVWGTPPASTGSSLPSAEN